MNNIQSRARCTASGGEPGSSAGGDDAVAVLANSIIFLCSLITDQPRAIDRYIDYFGEGSARVASFLSHPRFGGILARCE